MSISPEAKSSLLYLVSELKKETKLAKASSVIGVRKHVERISTLQLRLNAEIVKALCYGE